MGIRVFPCLRSLDHRKGNAAHAKRAARQGALTILSITTPWLGTDEAV
jgi:hypothetical protein